MSDPIRQPNLIADIQTMAKRIAALERATARRWTPQVLPTAPISSPVGSTGYVGQTTSSEIHAYRVDGHLTAPFLDYDFQVSDQFGTASTSIQWTLEAYPEDGSGPYDIVTGSSSAATEQVAGILDLRTVSGLDVVTGAYIRFDIRVQQTGGTVIACRLNKPLHLRTDS